MVSCGSRSGLGFSLVLVWYGSVAVVLVLFTYYRTIFPTVRCILELVLVFDFIFVLVSFPLVRSFLVSLACLLSSCLAILSPFILS